MEPIDVLGVGKSPVEFICETTLRDGLGGFVFESDTGKVTVNSVNSTWSDVTKR